MSEEKQFKDDNIELIEKLEKEVNKLRLKKPTKESFSEQGMEIHANHLAADILERFAKQLKREDDDKPNPTYE